MKTADKILLDILGKYWDDQGMCGSCSWHALLWEHDPEWEDWSKERGRFEFYCQNDDIDDEYSHRGVRIYISDDDKKKYAKFLEKGYK